MLRFILIPVRIIRFVGAALAARRAHRPERMQFAIRGLNIAMRLMRIEPTHTEQRLAALIGSGSGDDRVGNNRIFSRMLDILEVPESIERFIVSRPFQDGRPFYFDPRRLDIGQLDYLVERIITHDCYALRDITAPEPVIFDGGAHLGVFSRFVFAVHPNARLFAFEPDRENHEILQLNLSGHEAAEAVQMGLLDGHEELEFFASDEVDWRSSLNANPEFMQTLSSHQDEYGSSYSVYTTSIDSFVDAQQLDRLDLLKLVVPGMIEIRVLAGARHAIQKFKPRVAVSVYVGNENAVDAFFEELGYEHIESPWKQPEGLTKISSNRMYVPVK